MLEQTPVNAMTMWHLLLVLKTGFYKHLSKNSFWSDPTCIWKEVPWSSVPWIRQERPHMLKLVFIDLNSRKVKKKKSQFVECHSKYHCSICLMCSLHITLAMAIRILKSNSSFEYLSGERVGSTSDESPFLRLIYYDQKISQQQFKTN